MIVSRETLETQIADDAREAELAALRALARAVRDYARTGRRELMLAAERRLVRVWKSEARPQADP